MTRAATHEDDECSSEASSRASAASTSASSEPATSSLGSAKPTSGAAASSEPTGPESPPMTTWGLSLVGTDYAASEDLQPPLKAGNDRLPPLTWSVAGSPAKTSASPDDEPDSLADAAASSTSSPESLTLFSPLAGGSSLRTFPDFFPASAAEISPSFSRRWPTSGFTTSPGECWTADTSECPNGGAASSSLRDVLEAEVPRRYFLSPRAAAGILRRAEKRGRELPTHLSAALEAVAQTTTTDKPAAS